MDIGNMERRDLRSCDIVVCAIRVHPCMEFHFTLMRFSYHKFQWIVPGHWRLCLPAGQPLAPWFIWRWIECICRRAHLYYHGVHSILLMHIQKPDKICLLLFTADSGSCGP